MKKSMNKLLKNSFVLLSLVFLMSLISISFVYAHESHPEHDSFEQAEAIINANISCDTLSEDQLEMLGDYYMEQMHPGEAHELMDEMMGGDDSEQLKTMHINMAKSIYCGDKDAIAGNMMAGAGCGMMSNEFGGQKSAKGGMMSMMNGGMMSGSYGMMGGGYGFGSWFGWSLLWLLYVVIGAFVFGAVFWWTYNLIANKNNKKRK